MLLRAKKFPKSITHGFSTRHGGVSQGRFASLNLGSKWGDDGASVEENHRRLAKAGGFARDHLITVEQVHGSHMVSTLDAGTLVEADGIWAHSKMRVGAVVGVRTADCVPLLITSDCGKFVAAVHSGWRGTVENIAGIAIETLVQAGAHPTRLLAAIGPCIESESFEVGEEVAIQFPTNCVHRHPESGKIHVDLLCRVHEQLVWAGLNPDQIERVGGCTYSNPNDYFSYRREGKNTGQHLAFIGWRLP